MRRLLTPSYVALTVLAIATVVVLVLAFQRQEALSTSNAAVAPLPEPPSVAFVGDGWTSGTPAGGQGGANYTALLASREGWRVTNASVYGSGYVAGAVLGAQVPMVAAARPQLVVVSGGRADADEDPAVVRDAAARLYQDLRARLPQTAIVVIGPMWIAGDAPRSMRDVRDAINASAAAARLPFVDPITDRWFNGSDADGISPDGADLNDQGHRRLADLVDGALRKANAIPG